MSADHTLRLLGGLVLERADGSVVTGRAAQRRRLALLTLLALAPRRCLSRDRLAAYLWPENDTESARHLLSVAVYELRKILGEGLLIARGDELELDAALLRTDVDDFEAAAHAGNSSAALAAYPGPLLDGFHLNDAPEFERWVDTQRDRLSRLHATVLETAANEAAAQGDADGALQAWRQRAALDPYNNAVAIQLMLAWETAGDRAAAIRHASVHAALLREDLGAEPDPEIVALAERLRSSPAPAVAPTDPVRPVRSASVPAVDTIEASVGVSPARLIPEPPPESAVRSSSADERSPSDGTVVQRRNERRWPRIVTVAASLAACGWIIGFAWNARRDAAAPECTGGWTSIAVLPFRSAGATGGLTFFGDGLAEEILNALTGIECLHVVPRTAAFELGEQLDPHAAGRTLSVQYALSGTWRGGDEWLRVDPRLVEVGSGRLAWSDSYDLQGPWTMRDILRIQEDIAGATADALPLPTPGRRQNQPVVRRTTSDAVAFQLLYTGRRHLAARTVHDLVLAARLFEQAVERDPTYADAHAALAVATSLLGAYDYGILRPSEAYPAALQSADRALALDSAQAEARAARGNVFFNFTYDWERAEREYRRAIQLKPGYTPAYHWYSLLLATQGRLAEAERQLKTALAMDGASVLLRTALSRHYYFDGRYEEALRGYEEALQLDPTYVTAHIGLGMTYLALERNAEAIASFREAESLSPGPAPVIMALLGHSLGLHGDSAAAQEVLRWLEAAARESYVPAEYFALVHIGLAEQDAAIDDLRLAIENRSGGVAYLGVEPILHPIRTNPRFAELRSQLGI